MRVYTAEDIAETVSWPVIIEALRDGHRRPKAKTGDTLLSSGNRKMLVRSGWIEGVAAGVKAVTVFPDNQPPRPSVHGRVLLFDDETGDVSAMLDGGEVTKWKTAGDSALGADCLARKDVDVMLMIGAGAMAEPLVRAHLSVRPSIGRVMIWNRTTSRAEALAGGLGDLGVAVEIVPDLDAAIPQADFVCAATMAPGPILSGRLLKPGCHVDLVGAFTPDMREADDEALRRGNLFVDSYDTTIGEIGELMIPMAAGVIGESDVLGDLHTLVAGTAGRNSDDDITIFKNGGGAHLDIMTAQAIAAAG